jgi:hypothetical protein
LAISVATFSIAGCGKEEPQEIKSIRKLDNLKEPSK